jgi:hypothetical protein
MTVKGEKDLLKTNREANTAQVFFLRQSFEPFRQPLGALFVKIFQELGLDARILGNFVDELTVVEGPVEFSGNSAGNRRATCTTLATDGDGHRLEFGVWQLEQGPTLTPMTECTLETFGR